MTRTSFKKRSSMQEPLTRRGADFIATHRRLLLEISWGSYMLFVILGYPTVGIHVMLPSILLCGLATWLFHSRMGLVTVLLSLLYNMLAMLYNLDSPEGWKIAINIGGISAQLLSVLLITLAKRNHDQARELTAMLERKIQHRNNELQDLNDYLINQAKAERSRMSDQLCNTVSLQLSELLVLGENLKKSLGESDSPQASDAEKLITITNQSIEQVKTLTHKLSSQHLLDIGLEHALREMCSYFTETAGTHFSISTTGKVTKIPKEISIHLYRIAHEATTNALRHGRAKNIKVLVTQSTEVCTLEIINDGIPIEKSPTEGLGMRLIQQRAKTINAILSLKTIPSEKTHFICSIPLKTVQPEEIRSATADRKKLPRLSISR